MRVLLGTEFYKMAATCMIELSTRRSTVWLCQFQLSFLGHPGGSTGHWAKNLATVGDVSC